MADTKPYDAISGVALAAWEKAAPESYAECVQRVQAVLDEYGDLGVMVMLDVLDRFEPPSCDSEPKP